MSLSPEENTIELRNKIRIPAIGFDANFDSPEVSKAAVLTAIAAGYRTFYCNASNNVEKAIGEAIKESIETGKIKREDIFIVTRVYYNTGINETYVQDNLRRSMHYLSLDYVDLLLLHSSVYKQKKKLKFKPIWRAMEECVNSDLVKAIGFSNFRKGNVKSILKIAKIKPVVNQIECNFLVNRKSLAKFCKKKKIVLMALNTFGPSDQFVIQIPGEEYSQKTGLNKPIMLNLADDYNKEKNQIALRYLIERGIIPLVHCSVEQNIQENFNVFNFSLTKKEVKQINKLDDGSYDPNMTLFSAYIEEFGYYINLK